MSNFLTFHSLVLHTYCCSKYFSIGYLIFHQNLLETMLSVNFCIKWEQNVVACCFLSKILRVRPFFPLKFKRKRKMSVFNVISDEVSIIYCKLQMLPPFLNIVSFCQRFVFSTKFPGNITTKNFSL
jgi:hypothetical protein